MNAPQVHPVIVTITGPSASGKTVLSDLLHQAGLRTLVSSTTRAPRRGEVDGVAYHFMTEDEFNRRMEAGRFIESIQYNGTLYGVSADEAEKAFANGTSAVLVAEPHGSAQIVQYAQPRGWSVLRVFVDNPDEVLLSRLLNRLAQDVLGQARADHDLGAFTPTVQRLSQLLTGPKALAATDPQALAQTLPTLLQGFLKQMEPAQPVDVADERLVAAVKRLTAFGFEKTNWVEPARNGTEVYDIVTDRFDAAVEARVVDRIMNRVAQLQVGPVPVAPGGSDAVARPARDRLKI